jgi:hypothetical protein
MESMGWDKVVVNQLFHIEVQTTTDEVEKLLKDCAKDLIPPDVNVPDQARRVIAKRTHPIKEMMMEGPIVTTELAMVLSMIDQFFCHNGFWNCNDPNEATYLGVFIEPIIQATFGRLDLIYNR